MAATILTSIGCKGGVPAEFDIEMSVNTSINENGEFFCPMLTDSKFRKLVDKFGEGSVFAYPMIPYSCLSGSVQKGSIKFNNIEIKIDQFNSFSESAQRLISVPISQSIPNFDNVNLFASSDDSTLQLAGGMTVLHLQGNDLDGDDYIFDIIAHDTVLLTDSEEDTEEFVIMGSKGKYKFSGRLVGRGQVFNSNPLQFNINILGVACIR